MYQATYPRQEVTPADARRAIQLRELRDASERTEPQRTERGQQGQPPIGRVARVLP